MDTDKKMLLIKRLWHGRDIKFTVATATTFEIAKQVAKNLKAKNDNADYFIEEVPHYDENSVIYDERTTKT